MRWIAVLKVSVTIVSVFLQVQLALGQAVPVEVVETADGQWQLLRGGQPYYIEGAGGDGPKDVLAAAGGNTFRTWAVRWGARCS